MCESGKVPASLIFTEKSDGFRPESEAVVPVRIRRIRMHFSDKNRIRLADLIFRLWHMKILQTITPCFQTGAFLCKISKRSKGIKAYGEGTPLFPVEKRHQSTKQIYIFVFPRTDYF